MDNEHGKILVAISEDAIARLAAGSDGLAYTFMFDKGRGAIPLSVDIQKMSDKLIFNRRDPGCPDVRVELSLDDIFLYADRLRACIDLILQQRGPATLLNVAPQELGLVQTIDSDGNPVTIRDDGYRLYADDKVLVEYKHSEVHGASSIISGLLRDAVACQRIRESSK